MKTTLVMIFACYRATGFAELLWHCLEDDLTEVWLYARSPVKVLGWVDGRRHGEVSSQVYWDQEQFCGSWLNRGEGFIIGSPLLVILFGASWFCAHAGGTQPSWLTPALPSGLVSLLLWSALCSRALFAICCIITTSQG